ncbi:MAG TPA: NAD(P)-binding domain-containing protein [Longimicrobiales bacterium]
MQERIATPRPGRAGIESRGSDSRSAVTVIGLGSMGSALAGTLLDAGHPTTVWNRTAAKADPFVRRGATDAATVADAISASPLVIAWLLDYGALREVLGTARDALAGRRTVVNLTNGTPKEAREMAAWIERHGARYLDGGIMAVPEMIGRPESLVLYSGSADAYESFEPVLGRFGRGLHLGGDPGLASLHDLALLAGMYGLFGGFLHAVALVGTEGVRAAEFTSSLLIPWLQAMTATLPEAAAQIDAGDYASTGSRLDIQAVALANIVEASRSQGIRADLMLPIQALVERRVAKGGGGEDIARVVEEVRG